MIWDVMSAKSRKMGAVLGPGRQGADLARPAMHLGV